MLTPQDAFDFVGKYVLMKLNPGLPDHPAYLEGVTEYDLIVSTGLLNQARISLKHVRALQEMHT